ncbi:LANO_0D10704g1_1 [Lachancea nothofagi CBS 11611]|uniref:Ubiquitin thioesterase OTU n=1 Tax=Lachancea nothofagi CBS 11611 TaxID=1266666 RepID=A0A1G4JKS6_9SACH|nr:LANO_0D10704g1_1 [Lachancea nothofagi CBS 11611]
MKIKVSCTGLGTKVVSADNDCTLYELLELVSRELQSSKPFQCLRFGYPPQVIEASEANLSKKLEDIGLSSGEKVALVQQKVIGGIEPMAAPKTPRKLLENQISLDGIWPDRILQIHAVPDDNSCMFHAISYCVHGDTSHTQVFREIVASEIAADSVEYSDAILGKPNKEYSQWILKKTSWGGGIELAILSKVLKLCIYVLDVDACKFEKFNEQHFDDFVMVVFNGVHYDAMEVANDSSSSTVKVLNSRSDKIDQVLARALEVASKLKSKGYSFNTTRDRIKCNVCSEMLIGERDVARHAEKTGHFDFGQSKE